MFYANSGPNNKFRRINIYAELVNYLDNAFHIDLWSFFCCIELYISVSCKQFTNSLLCGSYVVTLLWCIVRKSLRKVAKYTQFFCSHCWKYKVDHETRNNLQTQHLTFFATILCVNVILSREHPHTCLLFISYRRHAKRAFIITRTSDLHKSLDARVSVPKPVLLAKSHFTLKSRAKNAMRQWLR